VGCHEDSKSQHNPTIIHNHGIRATPCIWFARYIMDMPFAGGAGIANAISAIWVKAIAQAGEPFNNFLNKSRIVPGHKTHCPLRSDVEKPCA